MQPKEPLIVGERVGREPFDRIVEADVAPTSRAIEGVAANQAMLVRAIRGRRTEVGKVGFPSGGGSTKACMKTVAERVCCLFNLRSPPPHAFATFATCGPLTGRSCVSARDTSKTVQLGALVDRAWMAATEIVAVGPWFEPRSRSQKT